MNASAPQRIGLLGGSFDPVHHGHLAMARAALQTGRLDAVWFVPAAASPFKIGAMHARAEDRVAMLRLAIGDTSGHDFRIRGFIDFPVDAEIDVREVEA